MLTISLTVVVLFSALVLLYQYATGALLVDDEARTNDGQPLDSHDEAPAARAA